MKNKILVILIFFIKTSFAQTLYVADSMESPASWRGTSSMINSMFTGGLSTAIDNPPNYPMYSSSDSCYMVKGIGLGSSALEVDTFTYANLPVVVGRTYEIRFKVASFGLNPGVNTASGVDGSSDTLEFQYRIAASGWFRDFKMIGSSNAMWSFDGAIGTNSKLTITRNANTTPNLYVSNASNPITNVSIRLNPGTYTTIQIRFISKLNGSGETWMLDDVEVWDVTPTLPIELVNFYGKHYGENIKLFWTTASEVNNDYFIIYKSYDGIIYDELDHVDGSGNSNVYINYEFLDDQICDTIVYYKLRQVDYDGNYTESDPIAIQCTENNNDGEIKCYDILGREVRDDYDGIKIYK